MKAPEARWVEKNLLRPMRSEWIGEELRVEVESAGIEQVARFVVGLGGAARVETEELREMVEALAEGARESARRAKS